MPEAFARRARLSLIAGIILAAGGLLVWLLSAFRMGNTADAVSELGRLAVIVGVVMGGISLLALKGRSIEEAYRLGYDLGFERGHQWASHEDEHVTRYLDEREHG